MEIRDDGVILDAQRFRDRDLIVAVLTPQHGVVRGVFRGARGGRAPRAAATQLLSLVHVSAYQGPHAEMASFRDIDLVRSSFSLTTDLATSTAAATIAELLLVFCPPGEPAEKPFRLARAVLEALLANIDPETAITYTQLWLLRLGGWLARLDRCAVCQSDLSEGSYRGESPGFICHSCAGDKARWAPDEVDFILRCLNMRPEQVTGAPSRGVRIWCDGLARSAAETGLRALEFHRSLEPDSRPVR